jgi:hypothetical protein
MSPFARTTRERFFLVAPIDASMPSERCRRWASTVKPPTATSAIRSMPIVSTTRESLGVEAVALRYRSRSAHIGATAAVGAARGARLADRARCHSWCVKEHCDLVRGRHLPRQNEGELVEEAPWILDDANHLPGFTADVPGFADGQVEVRCDSRRDGDLACWRGSLAAVARPETIGGVARSGRFGGLNEERPTWVRKRTKVCGYSTSNTRVARLESPSR